jgi:hypothetical protein
MASALPSAGLGPAFPLDSWTGLEQQPSPRNHRHRGNLKQSGNYLSLGSSFSWMGFLEGNRDGPIEQANAAKELRLEILQQRFRSDVHRPASHHVVARHRGRRDNSPAATEMRRSGRAQVVPGFRGRTQGVLPKSIMSKSRGAGWSKTVPECDLFEPLGLALSEKQIPQIIENTEKPKERMELLESDAAPKAGALPGCATPRHEPPPHSTEPYRDCEAIIPARALLRHTP